MLNKLNKIESVLWTFTVDDLNVDLEDFNKQELIHIIKYIDKTSRKLLIEEFPDYGTHPEIKLEEDYDTEISYQCWICPICHYDHSQDYDCTQRGLRDDKN